MKEDIIFSLYKDKPLVNSKKFTEQIKSKFGEVNTKELHLRIVNYQIDTYGYTLDDGDCGYYANYEENQRKIINAKNRKKANKRYWREK